MAQATWTKEEFWAELEIAGEDVVRERVVTKTYRYKRLDLAQEWLRLKDQERADDSRAEEIKLARRASEAAERAASAAERDASAAERAASAAERAAAAAEKSNQTAQTAKHITMAMLIVTAIGIVANAFLG